MIEETIAQNLFYLSEDSIYEMLGHFEANQMVDQSLVYCFAKAFYVYVAKLYIKVRKLKLDFDVIYGIYKENLKQYYLANNPEMEDVVLDQVLNFFDNSFGLIETVELSNVEDSYEFRHYVINVFELLRMMLEKNSKSNIRADLFDKDIRKIIEETEKIWDYMRNQEVE